jgi:hypothetical protein
MKRPSPPPESHLALTADVMSAKILVWVATVGRDAELTRDAHLFFYDRYSRLARYHKSHGRDRKAQRLAGKADVHYRAAGGIPDGPYAAAMAMPRPSRFVVTNAVSSTRFDDPDDAA